MNTCAIAGFSIRIHRTTVPNRFERGDAVFDNCAAGLAIDRHHQTNATRGMFFSLGVHAILGHPGALSCFCGYPISVIFCHFGLPNSAW